MVSRAPEDVIWYVLQGAKWRVNQHVRLGVVEHAKGFVLDALMTVLGVRIHARHVQENVLEIAVDVLVVDRCVLVIAPVIVIAVFVAVTYSVVRTALVVAMD